MTRPRRLRRLRLRPSTLPLAGALLLASACTPPREAPRAPAPPPELAVPLPPAPPAPAPAPSLLFRRAPDGTPLPPVARIDTVKSTVTLADGTSRELADDYAWLRERDAPEARAYVEAENEYAEAVLERTRPLQARLIAEMRGRREEGELTAPYRQGDFFYYQRSEPGRQYPLYCRKRGSLDAPEEVILDVHPLAEGHDSFRLSPLAISPDGDLLAFGYDLDGSERYTVRVKDLATGRLLTDTLERVSRNLVWAADHRTLFYTTEDESHRVYRAFRHTLGGRPGADTLVYEERDPAFELLLRPSQDGEVLFLSSESLAASEIRFLPADQPAGTWSVLVPRQPGVTYRAEHHRDARPGNLGGEGFFLLIDDTGPPNTSWGFRLVWAPARDLSPARWQTLIPASPDATLLALHVFRDHLAVFERRDGLPKIRIRDLATGREHWVAFPEPVYSVQPTGNAESDTDRLRFVYSSPLTPPSIFDYRMSDRTRELVQQTRVPGGFDPSRYVSERIYAQAADGARVPVSLIYRRGLVRDGSNPCLLSGYGAFGASLEPEFDVPRLSLLDRGFVLALAHVRGGGELGAAWHLAGTKAGKVHTFGDFIAVAEELIRAGYTSPRRLAASGASAGGILIGAVLNLRPDLFAAALAGHPAVATLDALLDPSASMAVPLHDELGDPRQPADFDLLRSYSPYDNVRAQAYPQLLVLSGWNDSRVAYWQPTRWVAKLRATTTGNRRVLLRTVMNGGHVLPQGSDDALAELAFEYAFLIDALGLPE